MEQFKTHSSTIEPKAAPVEGSVDPAVPHVSSQDTHPPLEVTEASGLTSQTRVADWFWDSVQRPSASRIRPREMETLTRVPREALSKLEVKVERQRQYSMHYKRKLQSCEHHIQLKILGDN